MDGAGRVCDAHVVQCFQEPRCALVLLVLSQTFHVAPLDDVGLSVAPETLARFAHSNPREHPVAGPGLLHADVVDDASDAGLGDDDLAVEHLTHDQGLGATLLEAAHVQQSGRIDVGAVDARDPGHGDEDPAATQHFSHQSDDAGLESSGPQRHHNVAHLADLVTLRVHDGQPDQAGREDAGWCGAHGQTLPGEARYPPNESYSAMKAVATSNG